MSHESKDCLNRTMQYGNEADRKRKAKEKKSLNRTMQYGNIYNIKNNKMVRKV